MKLCECRSGPVRSTLHADRLRCFACGGWTAHGHLLHPDRVALLAGEARSLLTRLTDDYPYVYDLAHHPTRRPQNGRSGIVGDPTGNSVVDEDRDRMRDYSRIGGRRLERVVRDLYTIDEAIGDALLAAEPPGPADHVQAPFHDPATLFPGRPDLEYAHEAKTRRRGRGEL